jgi:hypothetical protein
MSQSKGRIVHYRLTPADAQAINKRRDDYAKAEPAHADTGYIAHVGNRVREGEYYPAMVVRVNAGPPETVNLQVSLDGSDQYWATSVTEGDDVGQWTWPPRV